MTSQNVGQEILDGLKEIKKFKAGTGHQLVKRELKDPSSAKEIRDKLELSQDAFASLMGVSTRTIQDWEQGRREPQGPAKSLLRVAEQHPEVFVDLR